MEKFLFPRLHKNKHLLSNRTKNLPVPNSAGGVPGTVEGVANPHYRPRETDTDLDYYRRTGGPVSLVIRAVIVAGEFVLVQSHGQSLSNTIHSCESSKVKSRVSVEFQARLAPVAV